jgi:hypothetical protein
MIYRRKLIYGLTFSRLNYVSTYVKNLNLSTTFSEITYTEPKKKKKCPTM